VNPSTSQSVLNLLDSDPRWEPWRARLERTLDATLPPAAQTPQTLHAAMRYACLDGGKRLRAIAVYSAGAVFAAPDALLDRAAAAVEMVHAYSLIHDDLPAMDDDDLRRGRPATHRAFSEATAILAGDALQSFAFEVLAADTGIDSAARASMIGCLATAIGPSGMAGGQAMDLDAETRQVDLAELEQIHARKTGALIRASVRLGALAAGASDRNLDALDDFASAVGLAFQIVDDVLDEEGDTATLGKNSGSDREQNKSTYVSLLGIEKARQQALDLHNHALACLDRLSDNAGSDTASLRALSGFAISRSY